MDESGDGEDGEAAGGAKLDPERQARRAVQEQQLHHLLAHIADRQRRTGSKELLNDEKEMLDLLLTGDLARVACFLLNPPAVRACRRRAAAGRISSVAQNGPPQDLGAWVRPDSVHTARRSAEGQLLLREPE